MEHWYPTKKKYLGVYPLIEIYLFIHPLGKFCAEAEKRLLDFTQASDEKIDLHIVPLVNPSTIAQSLKQKKVSLTQRNDYFQLAYRIALDFKAAQIQGKKYAREFLLSLQEKLLYQNEAYSDTLVQNLFTATSGDLAMFLEDRQSSLVKELFWRDQQTARELHVSKQTSAVIYDCNYEGDGILLEGLTMMEEVLDSHLLSASKTTSFPCYKTNKAYN